MRLKTIQFLASGVWDNVGGPTTNTTTTIPFTNTKTFFRIQNLPNP